MKVLLVNGSPHKEGNTYIGLRAVKEELEKQGLEAEIFHIGNQPIYGCQGCKACRSTGECAYNKIVNIFREKAKQADGFIFATPVHYAAISGGMKCFMDTLFYSNRSDAFYLKPAASVVCARRSGTTAAFDELNKYYTISQMPVISSCYWNNIHGSTAPEAEEDEEGIYTLQVLARNMAYFIKCQKKAEENGIEKPEKTAGKRTNFIR